MIMKVVVWMAAALIFYAGMAISTGKANPMFWDKTLQIVYAAIMFSFTITLVKSKPRPPQIKQ